MLCSGITTNLDWYIYCQDCRVLHPIRLIYICVLQTDIYTAKTDIYIVLRPAYNTVACHWNGLKTVDGVREINLCLYLCEECLHALEETAAWCWEEDWRMRFGPALNYQLFHTTFNPFGSCKLPLDQRWRSPGSCMKTALVAEWWSCAWKQCMKTASISNCQMSNDSCHSNFPVIAALSLLEK